MIEIVNRSGLDALPNEYFDGIYDSQTDMFYLAELFNRIIKVTKNDTLFSYQHIVDKMMNVQKEQRYKNFAEIKAVIGKKDFSTLEISKNDKAVYQNFSNAIFKNIECYTSEKAFNSDISSFKARLESLIEKNCFENFLQNNSELIRSIVLCSYRYYKNNDIDLDIVKDFYTWFASLTEKSQNLVLKNMIYKLSNIRELIEDDDLPF